MERLTKKHYGGNGYYMACSEHCNKECFDCKEIDKIIDRLGTYEDTGLEPEDMAHWMDYFRAECEGRLVVMPCKVGDSVYIPDLDKKIPVKVRVQGISISVSGRTILLFGGYPVECAWGDRCGKDWFLTREEAEAAMKGGEG